MIPNWRSSPDWVSPNRLKTGPTRAMFPSMLKQVPLPPFTIHDLRRSLATGWAEALGADDGIIGLQLAHTPQTVTASVYQRSPRLRERMELMDRWHALISET